MEKPDIYADFVGALNPDEKRELRAILLHPLYVRLLRVAECKKPSSMSAKCGANADLVDEHTMARSTIKLAEIRGWELHTNAIFLALNEAPEIRSAGAENFPDTGRVDDKWGELPPAVDPPKIPAARRFRKAR